MTLKNGLKMSSYKNGDGETVTLYTNGAGYMASVVCGQVTMYNQYGEMLCGAPDEDAAIKNLLEWNGV